MTNLAINTCYTCGLQTQCLPKELDRSETARLTEWLERSEGVPAGTVLHREGAALDGLYVVHSGLVATSRTLASGEAWVSDFRGPGSVLGVEGLETGMFSVTATVLEESTICFLPHAAYEQLWQEEPRLEFGLLRIASRDLNRKQLLRLMQQRATESGFLRRLLQAVVSGFATESRTDSPVPWPVRLALPLRELCSHLGLTIAELERTIEQEGLAAGVRLEGAHLLLPDVGVLFQTESSVA